MASHEHPPAARSDPDAPWPELDSERAELLVAEHGSPLYVYDVSRVETMVEALRDAIAGLPLTLRYAVKANPHPKLLAALHSLVDGLDVASGGELTAGLEAGFGGAEIAFAGPGKSDAELETALAAGARISVESRRELRRLGALTAGREVDICLRVNPREKVHAYALSTGGGACPFGIDEEQLPEVIEDAKALGLRVMGLHVHPGSQCFSAAAMARSFAASLALARRLAASEGLTMEVLNLGGGLGAASWPQAKRLDVTDLGGRLAKLWAEHLAALPSASPAPCLELEPGRYIIGPAGAYLCRVLDIKESRGERFVVLDGGMHQLFAATGLYGPHPPRPPLLANLGAGVEGRPLVCCNVVGRLCTPLDRLATAVELPAPRVGDVLAFYGVGAYGLSASPQGFLSHAPPGEVLLRLKGRRAPVRTPSDGR